MDDDQLSRVRRFNRAVTHRIGVLDGNYLGSGRPLGEARLLFEIGRDGATVRELRARLGLDSGYVSRLLRTFEAEQLTRSEPDARDARVRRVTLTPKGEREWDMLDQRSRDRAVALLEPLGPSQRQRLLDAMAEVERFLRASAVVIEPADPLGDEAQACLQAYFQELAARFDTGFDPARSAPAEPGDLVPPSGWFLVARLDGAAVGCGALKIKGDGYGEIKRMWVAPPVRGLGLARRLLRALEDRAAAAGVDVLQLDTNGSLTEARKLYARNGYDEIPPYNDNPYAQHWFEKRGLRRDR
ncbi:helix-turn-helix domain-containing GNAT family N-acetyltransferase [Nitrospirillum sp. BR 11163]|uniref:bifunctional helix-turn-helix transcriptional regulator/GNAT family N-acetyltransferase n=1 Tax=Nitrospirillum sp. BR 11163 TaxID=3104323 RepID=UPI002AFF7F68|nr:helix-turn-helix domain-containing GNAT family N-acetyltransferase [Nitrospirillum sp. BR 11163]MEA1674471.1 helix-turn-helix domain-containing GNAT family N-acetyltransferase [Nitrospirillum sp. BR 11163]